MDLLYIIPALLIAGIPIAMDYQRQRSRARMDEILPLALLELSTLPIHSLQDVAAQLSSGYGPVSARFNRARKLMEKGIPPTSAMRSAAEKTTPLFQHAVEMIIAGYRSGADWNQIIRKTAEDMEAVVDMERQRRASLSLQKYNVLLSAGVFVPAILGISERMVQKLSVGTWNPLISALNATILPYILILAAESAIFLALLEGKMRNAAYYGVVLGALGVASFFIAMGI